MELYLVLRAPPRRSRVMVRALQSLAKSARAESGCTGVRLFGAIGDPRCVCYVETWESEAVMRRMIASEHFSQLAALMELAAEPPECQFRVIAEIRGLEYAAQVRNCSDDRGGVAALPGHAASAREEEGDPG
ncbi:putative quinol monooxygenase [Methylohalobius crimeensis]|uniref:putative quinol monooxygenase n=1 Tax=Methylohalobius crimeensis TaxID=244365 RepID=UPI002283A6AC|nr:antibiotic biosynthesis monooxygenase [Methylohalobius crimeensis]